MTAVIAVTVADPTCLADLNEVHYHYAQDLDLALREAQRFRELNAIVTVRSQVIDAANPDNEFWYQSIRDSDFAVVEPIYRNGESVNARGHLVPLHFSPVNAPVLRVLANLDIREGHWDTEKNAMFFDLCSQHDENRFEATPCRHCVAGLRRDSRIMAYAIDFPENRLGRINLHRRTAEELGRLAGEGEPYTSVRIWRDERPVGRPPRVFFSRVHPEVYGGVVPMTPYQINQYARELPFLLDPLVHRFRPPALAEGSLDSAAL